MKKKKPIFNPLNVVLTAVIFIGFSLAIAFAAPRSELDPYWDKHDPNSVVRIDHSPLSIFLDEYRAYGKDGVARVAYHTVKAEDQKQLNTYLEALQQVSVLSLNKHEQFAYWVNLYNAATLALILEHKPQNSIKEINISPGFFSSGPWGKEYLKVEGRLISLNTIEHNILRPIWKDPRTHYVINCASVGCPDIPEKALSAENLDQKLDKAAKTYINHPRGVAIEGSEVTASSIFNWFSEDFGANDAEILDHIRLYADDNLLKNMKNATSIENYRYDWDLNYLKKDGSS